MKVLTAYYNENDKGAAAWLRELIKGGHIAPGDVDERSIKDVQPDELRHYAQSHFFAGIGGWSLALRLAGWPDDRPVWTGSCPCQDFSNAGSKAGIGGDRDLWPEMFRLVQECRPDRIYGEQVDDSPEWYDRAANDLEAFDYTCGAVVVPAYAVGADHERQRLFFVADSGGVGQSQQRKHWTHTGDPTPNGFREADRLVDAFRRKALPFLCRGHDGLSNRVGEMCIKGFGNAIVPDVAAEFIRAAGDAMKELLTQEQP